MDIQLGPIKVTSGAETPKRMALLLWGPAAAGKTTWAATAPGKKLWLSFGDQEHVSVMHRDDVLVANVNELPLDELFKHAQSDNPFGLDKVLSENEEIGTVVVDSLTAIAFRALQHAVKKKIGGSRTFEPSMETPGQSAYGARNAIVLETLTGLLRVTAKHNVHIIITAHESDPKVKTDDRGNEVIDYITVMLGGQLVNNMSYRLSEVWHMQQNTFGEKLRRVTIRNYGLRRPMKTRMFKGNQEPAFDLYYDAHEPDKGQMTIASFVDLWIDQNGEKLDVPEGPAKLPKKTGGKK